MALTETAVPPGNVRGTSTAKMLRPKVFVLLLVAVVTVAEVRAVRTWTSATGSKIDADFIDFKDGRVRLRKTSGIPISVPIEKLSAADQAYVRQLAGQASGKEDGDDEPADTSPPDTAAGTSGGTYLGIRVMGLEAIAKKYDVKPRGPVQQSGGAMVLEVAKGSPAEEAELQPGDIVTNVGDAKIRSPKDLVSWLEKQAPESRHSLVFYRLTKGVGGESFFRKRAGVTLKVAPANASRFVAALPAKSGKLPADVKSYLTALDQHRQELIEGINEQLERTVIIGILGSSRGQRVNLWQRAAEMYRNREQLRLNDPPVYLRLHENNLRVGAMGVIETIRVAQVVDNGFHGYLGDMRIHIAGVGTDGLADGDRLRVERVFKITGTERYTTVLGGTNTIYVAKLMDLGRHAPQVGNRDDP